MRTVVAALTFALILSVPVLAAKEETRDPKSVSQPAPELQSLIRALSGRWLVILQFEPDESMPHDGAGQAEEIYRAGPGGFAFIEEVHNHTPIGEEFAVAFVWWDSAKGLRGLWCKCFAAT